MSKQDIEEKIRELKALKDAIDGEIIALGVQGRKAQIKDILCELGISERMIGYRYIIDALEIARNEPDALLKQVYPDIARRHNTCWKNVERNIRFAIQGARKDAMRNYFGGLISDKGTVSNGKFLKRIAEFIKAQEMNDDN